MEAHELKDAITNLEKSLEGKSAEFAKTAVTEMKSAIDVEIKGLLEKAGEANEAQLTELKGLAEAQQKHLDTLDVKIQSGGLGKKEMKTVKQELKSAIQDNFEQIKTVKKGHSVELEIKAVGDMTTANITGDEERDFSNVVAKVPNQKVNFSDLVGVIPIGGGTYTFPRESAGEGAMATQTEGASKAQRDYDFAHIDVTTDFIAGFARYSKKMANNVQYLESFLPGALRRDYLKAESGIFNTALIAQATASAQIITGKNKPEMIMNEIATLEALDFDVDGIVMTTADYYSILQVEKSGGAGYGLPLGWSFDGNVLRCLGIAVVKANWLAPNKYYVGDWSTVKKVVTEGLSVQFSTEDGDNFTKNNITGRIESQVGLAVHRPDAVIFGDFTAV